VGTLSGLYNTGKPIAPIEDGARSSTLAVWQTNMRIPHLDTRQFELVRLLFSISLTVFVCVGSFFAICYLIGSPVQLNAGLAAKTPTDWGHQQSVATKQRRDRQGASANAQGSAAPAKLLKPHAVQPTNQAVRQ
jgi:hypothetical protein